MKTYQEPELNLVYLDTREILTTSDTAGDVTPVDPNLP